jgi:hypothetical protein
VSGITAQTSSGGVRLSWPSAGLGLRYRVYRETASGTWVKVRTVWPTQITITGLSTGSYEFKVVAVNIYASTGPAGYVTVPVR